MSDQPRLTEDDLADWQPSPERLDELRQQLAATQGLAPAMPPGVSPAEGLPDVSPPAQDSTPPVPVASMGADGSAPSAGEDVSPPSIAPTPAATLSALSPPASVSADASPESPPKLLHMEAAVESHWKRIQAGRVGKNWSAKGTTAGDVDDWHSQGLIPTQHDLRQKLYGASGYDAPEADAPTPSYDPVEPSAGDPIAPGVAVPSGTSTAEGEGTVSPPAVEGGAGTVSPSDSSPVSPGKSSPGTSAAGSPSGAASSSRDEEHPGEVVAVSSPSRDGGIGLPFVESPAASDASPGAAVNASGGSSPTSPAAPSGPPGAGPTRRGRTGPALSSYLGGPGLPQVDPAAMGDPAGVTAGESSPGMGGSGDLIDVMKRLIEVMEKLIDKIDGVGPGGGGGGGKTRTDPLSELRRAMNSPLTGTSPAPPHLPGMPSIAAGGAPAIGTPGDAAFLRSLLSNH